MHKVAFLLALIVTAYSFGLSDITGAASNIVNSATDTIRNAANGAVNQATANFQRLASQTNGIISDATNKVSSTVNTAINTAKNAASDAVQTVKNTANTVVTKVQDAANTAVNFVKQKVDTFMGQINNLSNYMCQNQCTSFFNLPCFLLFRCYDKIKKFFFMLVAPILVVIVIMIGCCTGLFNIPCFFKFIGIITGIYPIILIVRCMRKKEQQEKMKDEAFKQAKAHLQEISKGIKGQMEPQTSKPFNANYL